MSDDYKRYTADEFSGGEESDDGAVVELTPAEFKKKLGERSYKLKCQIFKWLLISLAICFVTLFFLLKANPNANGLTMKQQFYLTLHTA